MGEFITDIGRGMRRVSEAERQEFDGLATDALNERLREWDRCRERGAHDLRRLASGRTDS